MSDPYEKTAVYWRVATQEEIDDYESRGLELKKGIGGVKFIRCYVTYDSRYVDKYGNPVP